MQTKNNIFDFSDTAGYQNCQIGQINVYILIQAYLCLINSFNIDKHNKYIDTNWFFEIDNIKTTIVKDFIIKSINQIEISDTIGWSLWRKHAHTWRKHAHKKSFTPYFFLKIIKYTCFILYIREKLENGQQIYTKNNNISKVCL